MARLTMSKSFVLPVRPISIPQLGMRCFVCGAFGEIPNFVFALSGSLLNSPDHHCETEPPLYRAGGLKFSPMKPEILLLTQSANGDAEALAKSLVIVD